MKQYYRFLTGGTVILSDTKKFKDGQIFCSKEAMFDTVKDWEDYTDTQVTLIFVN